MNKLDVLVPIGIAGFGCLFVFGYLTLYGGVAYLVFLLIKRLLEMQS